VAIRKANSAAVVCCGCGLSAGGPIKRGRNEADIKGNLARRYTYMTYDDVFVGRFDPKEL
jgi:hypothetical protein